MAACEVSIIIASIVSAYNSGLDVFKKLKCTKRSKSSTRYSQTAQEEILVQSSLQRRPKDIRLAYDSNVAALGQRFEIGDAIAHSSLAHTLLVLNSGLINVLNTSLSADVARRRQSQRSLLSISEVAAAEALNALTQLNHRLTVHQSKVPAPLPIQVTARKPRGSSYSRKPSKTIVDITIDPKVKSRAENNLLVRGGWIRPRSARISSRSRSDSSVVSLASSLSGSATKLADQKKSKSGTASPRESSQSPRSSVCPKNYSRIQSSPVLLPPQTMEPPFDGKPQRRHPTAEGRTTPRQPSMLTVPADFFDSHTDLPPPRPPKIPLQLPPGTSDALPRGMSVTLPRGMRPRPPSVATFMTGSTKIGEIPEHRWPDRIPQAREELRPMPYIIPPPLNMQGEVPPSTKKRGFRFWGKKSQRAVQAVVY